MKNLFLLLFLSIALVSCKSSKQAAMEDLRGLTSEIRQNANDYNFSEWLKQQQKYQKIENRLQKHEYTAEESREIGELKGECLGYFAKGVLGKTTNKVMDAANQIQGIIDGIQKALKP